MFKVRFVKNRTARDLTKGLRGVFIQLNYSKIQSNILRFIQFLSGNNIFNCGADFRLLKHNRIYNYSLSGIVLVIPFNLANIVVA